MALPDDPIAVAPAHAEMKTQASAAPPRHHQRHCNLHHEQDQAHERGRDHDRAFACGWRCYASLRWRLRQQPCGSVFGSHYPASA